VSARPSDADRVRALREVLTATGAGIYLVTHVAGPLPAETMAAVHESDELELRLGRVGPDRADDLEQREREARAAVAAAVRASYEHVVLSHGSAEAARGIALEVLAARAGAPSSVVVVEGLAPHVVRAIESVAAALGADVDLVPATPRILGTGVALVAMAHVDPLGRLIDPAPLAAAAHRAGARLLVDASLSVGALPLEVSGLGADALIADVHRWLLGPDALALVWLSPTLGDHVSTRLRDATGPFGRGTLLALARSVGWLLMYVELPWAIARTGRLARRLRGALVGVDGVTLLGDADDDAALIAFRVRGWDAESAADELSRSVFAMTDPEGEADVIRVSVGAWNREDELDRFVERVTDLATDSPATLPRKPSLTVISGPLAMEEDV
jgi:selenocysteine lyase/cysteine desulfurase